MEETVTSLEEYYDWLCENHDFNFDHEDSYYSSTCLKLISDLTNSDFWKNLSKKLLECDFEYKKITTGYNLLLRNDPPLIQMKPFKSLMQKTYRFNIIDNSLWPEKPPKGWVLPINWFERVNDILRTSITVKYIDGVEFLTKKINEFCIVKGICCDTKYEAKIEGYYASHIYIKKEFWIPDKFWDVKKAVFEFEIQITTQMQELIKELLHKFYEIQRLKRVNNEWQWNYKDVEFTTNYLGHIIHYLEGVIYNVRNEGGLK